MSTQLLGQIVTWDIDAKEVQYADLQQALVDAGLDRDAAKDMEPRAAFSRACQELKKDRAIDKVEAVGKKIKFQFTSKATDSGKVDYQYECAVYLETDSGVITCPESKEIEAQATSLFAEAIGKRNSQDVTRLVQSMFTKNADLYPINPKTGVAYFVPEKFSEFTAKVDDFLRRIGGGLSRFPVPTGTAEGNASVRDAVQAGLSSVVADLSAAVEGWDEKTRKSTIEKAKADFDKAQYKVEAYAEYLQSEQEGLVVKIAEAKKALLKKVFDLTPAEAPVDAPAEETAVAA